jgi:hypothetical protein
MRKRKLQVFVSSTYTDLIDDRLAAIEAILAAGHIPAAMEQFTPGDETAWEKIRRWIDESDCYMLILGGRYGSLEPSSGKSYVHLEYEYALDQKKPYFSLLMEDSAFKKRLKARGTDVDEREYPANYKQFKSQVKQRHCGFWADRKDIRNAILQKLPEWSQRDDLLGWIRGNEAIDPQVTNELARLSRENNELRSKVSASEERFGGLTFDEMSALLRQDKIDLSRFSQVGLQIEEVLAYGGIRPSDLNPTVLCSFIKNAGDVFEYFHDYLSVYTLQFDRLSPAISHPQLDMGSALIGSLVSPGLLSVQQVQHTALYTLSADGRRYRNRLLTVADPQTRRSVFWRVDA